MAIPKVSKEQILQALDYIDKNGIPLRNQSTKYELVADNGKRYPPKYVIAVADHLATGAEINIEGYNSVEAKNYLSKKGFTVEMRQEKFELVITQNQITSTDPRFDMDNLGLGDNYKSLDAYFKKADGTVIRRNYAKHERKRTNQTLPRLAFQLYEREIEALSAQAKESFPICKYNPSSAMICGIYDSIAAFQKDRKTIEYVRYRYGNGREFVVYCWNLFTTLIFVQECLKRFGLAGDSFVLLYRDKGDKEEGDTPETEENNESIYGTGDYLNSYSPTILESKNVIFRGAPGTGKSYLARQIAADIVSNGFTDDYTVLSARQQQQVEFVQFHPGYDYADFVEGLRPKLNPDGSMGFSLQDGIFKRFVDRARKDFEAEDPKNYVFIIDEINRGEISKILGELFFSIDPGYRGRNGAVSTQYANLHADPNEKFYIPKNVYIIGTMNDIDRSVDTFDFAMRRRFRFIEVKVDDNLSMLDKLGDEDKKDEAIRRMTALNREIAATEGLNENYQIGAAYFLKLRTLSFEQLWTDYLRPLLQEYINGMYDEKNIMLKFEQAYEYGINENNSNEATEN